MDLYDIAREVTDEAMGDGTYAQLNRTNPDPEIQAALNRCVDCGVRRGFVHALNCRRRDRPGNLVGPEDCP